MLQTRMLHRQWTAWERSSNKYWKTPHRSHLYPFLVPCSHYMQELAGANESQQSQQLSAGVLTPADMPGFESDNIHREFSGQRHHTLITDL